MRALIAFALFALATPAHSLTHHVNPYGTGDYATIQAAIAACAPGDTVLCAPGTYTGPGNRALDFGGVDLLLRSEGGPEVTTLDAVFAAPGIIFQSGESRAALVEGFTIRRGAQVIGGAGILIYSGSPTLRDLIIEDCVAWGEIGPIPGGGMVCWEGSPLLEDLLFRRNVGAGGGALLLQGDVDAELRRVEFREDNWGAALIVGGARASFEDVLFEQSKGWPALQVAIVDSLTLEGIVFRDSYGLNPGVALRATEGKLTLRDCLFHDNRFTFGDADEGIIDLDDVELTMENCTIAHSRSGNGAGAALSLHAPRATRVERTLIAGGTGLAGVTWDGLGEYPVFACSDVHGFEGGNFAGSLVDPTGMNDNISADPIFCGPLNDLEYLYSVSAASPCLPGNNSCGAQIGALGEGCPAPSELPEAPLLDLNLVAYPNPFNPSTRLAFDLPRPARVRLTVHDIAGRRLVLVAEGHFDAGRHELSWDGRSADGEALASGVYFAVLHAPDGRRMRKITLLK